MSRPHTTSMQLSLKGPDPLAFLMRNLRSQYTRGLPLRTLLEGWMRGFDSEHIRLFGLGPGTWERYLPDFLRYRMTHATNRNVWPILHDKLIFDRFMRDELPVARARLLIHDGTPASLDAGFDVEHLVASCLAGQPWVIKHAQSGTGQNLYFVDADDGKFVVNGDVLSEDAFRGLLGRLDYHLCYERSLAHPVLRDIFPSSSNALRVTAFVDVHGEPRLLTPVLCVGTSRSMPLEHLRHGGLIVAIDPQRGTTHSAWRQTAAGERASMVRHPDTGHELLGISIPHWAEIRDSLIAFHRTHPWFDCVGWDIVVEQECFRVIEGNHNPGLRVPLVCRSLDEEPDFRDFLESRGVLPRWYGS